MRFLIPVVLLLALPTPSTSDELPHGGDEQKGEGRGITLHPRPPETAEQEYRRLARRHPQQLQWVPAPSQRSCMFRCACEGKTFGGADFELPINPKKAKPPAPPFDATRTPGQRAAVCLPMEKEARGRCSQYCSDLFPRLTGKKRETKENQPVVKVQFMNEYEGVGSKWVACHYGCEDKASIKRARLVLRLSESQLSLLKKEKKVFDSIRVRKACRDQLSLVRQQCQSLFR